MIFEHSDAPVVGGVHLGHHVESASSLGGNLGCVGVFDAAFEEPVGELFVEADAALVFTGIGDQIGQAVGVFVGEFFPQVLLGLFVEAEEHFVGSIIGGWFS